MSTTENTPAKQRPTLRLSYCPVTKDGDGKESVGQPVDIGASWERKNGKGGVIRLKNLPAEVQAYFDAGVVFVTKAKFGAPEPK